MTLDIPFAGPASPRAVVGDRRQSTSQRMRRALLAITSIDPGADDIDTLMALSEAQQIAGDALQPLA
jgi:hypothetical protein